MAIDASYVQSIIYHDKSCCCADSQPISSENLRRSIDNVVRALRGTKRVDLYQSGRVDVKVGVESMVQTIAGFVKEGLVDHVGLSECGEKSLRAGNAVRIRCSAYTDERSSRLRLSFSDSPDRRGGN